MDSTKPAKSAKPNIVPLAPSFVRKIIDYLKDQPEKAAHVADIAKHLKVESSQIKNACATMQVKNKIIYWHGRFASLDGKEDWVLGLNPKQRKNAIIIPQDDPDDKRPIIECKSEGFKESVEEGIESLVKVSDVYSMRRELVRIVDHEILPLSHSVLTYVLDKAARWKIPHRSNPSMMVPHAPPERVVAAILEMGLYPTLKELIGIRNAPIGTWRPGHAGLILHSSGFIPTEGKNTGYLVKSSANVDDLRDENGLFQEAASAAYKWITNLLCDFKFENPPVAKAVFISCLLTDILRPIIKGAVPGICIDAPRAGSGKSLLQNVIFHILIGRDAFSRSLPPTKPFADRDGNTSKLTDEEELMKFLSADMRKGYSLYNLNNCDDMEIESHLLTDMITACSVSTRTLGKTETVESAWRGQILINGNQLRLSQGLHRRFLRMRMLVPPKGKRDFHFGRDQELIDHIERNRNAILRNLCIIAENYYAACHVSEDGHILPPDNLDVSELDSFGGWCEVITPMVKFASGGVDPVESITTQNKKFSEEADQRVDAMCSALKHILPKLEKAASTPDQPKWCKVEGLKTFMHNPSERGINFSTLLEQVFLADPDEPKLKAAQTLIREIVGSRKSITAAAIEENKFAWVKRLGRAFREIDERLATDGTRFITGQDRTRSPLVGIANLASN